MRTSINFQKQPIAHEVIYPKHIDRSLINCVRFVILNYLHNQDLKMPEFCKLINIDYKMGYRIFGMHLGNHNSIQDKSFELFCNYFNVSKDNIYKIAEEFKKHNHNVLIVNKTLTKAKFYYGYKASFETDESNENIQVAA